MTTQSAPPATSGANEAVASLRQDYETQQALLQAQAPMVQRFLEAQARQLGDAIMAKPAQIKFTLPDKVVEGPGQAPLAVPAEVREQLVGSTGFFDRLSRMDSNVALRQRLTELSGAPQRATAIAADVLRHATALHMVRGMLPSGRPVRYVAAEGEEIPTLPVMEGLESAITEARDAIAEDGSGDAGRGELQTPFVPAARRFFLPQWVMFDDGGQLLVNSVNEAQARLSSMQRFISVLHATVSLAPYMVADEEYQRKRYGMLGQLINQGRALACYQIDEIIRVIKQRVAANDLNRGLSLSLPYFDDQDLALGTHDFVVIPAGRIMFVPAFVVRAAREEEVKVAQDTRLNASTRRHLLSGLKRLEQAFGSANLPA